MHSAIILLASAALLFSGAAAQATAGQTQAVGEQSCDPAAVTAEPPCPFGKWCPGSGKCPPNPCLTFPCVNGHCELTKPDDGPQGNQLPAPHTPMCVCNEGFHCAKDSDGNPDCFVSNSCVPDVVHIPCCDNPDTKPDCPVCPDGTPGQCEDHGDGTCGCVPCHIPVCDPVTCPAHSHKVDDPTITDPADCCACDTDYCGPGQTWQDDGFCTTHSTCCELGCTNHGQCVTENNDPTAAASCQCFFSENDPTISDHSNSPRIDRAHPHGLLPWTYGDRCQFMDPCREKNCGAHGRCFDSDPDCADCFTPSCQCDVCFSGDNCEVEQQCCDPSTGGEKTCGDHGHLNTDTCECECTDCFTGEQCDVAPDIDMCHECVDNVLPLHETADAKKCEQHCGRCNPATGHCDCQDGYFGDHCESLDACSARSCGANGRCIQHGTPPDSPPAHDASGHPICPLPDVSCKCDPGFSGDNCEIDHCQGMVCSEHGRCTHDAAQWTPPSWDSASPVDLKGVCKCTTEGWTGEQCEIPPPPVDPCMDEEWTCNGHGYCGADADGNAECTCDKGYCGDHCDILEWGGALRGGVFTDPGATSGGQRAAVGVVGMAAAAVIVKRRMALAVAPAGETIYAPQV